MEDEWVPVADIPRVGGWQRVAQLMGYDGTDPYLRYRVEARRRQRRSDGLARQIRLDSPPDPTPAQINELIDKMDEVIEVMRNTRRVSAPERPRPTDPKPEPRPSPRGGNTGKGGVQLP